LTKIVLVHKIKLERLGITDLVSRINDWIPVFTGMTDIKKSSFLTKDRPRSNLSGDSRFDLGLQEREDGTGFPPYRSSTPFTF
ncbi:MAG: hypothetical protein WCO10_00845, partial [bacterium]